MRKYNRKVSCSGNMKLTGRSLSLMKYHNYSGNTFGSNACISFLVIRPSGSEIYVCAHASGTGVCVSVVQSAAFAVRDRL